MEMSVEIIITILILILCIAMVGLRTAMEIREIERAEEDEIQHE